MIMARRRLYLGGNALGLLREPAIFCRANPNDDEWRPYIEVSLV